MDSLIEKHEQRKELYQNVRKLMGFGQGMTNVDFRASNNQFRC